MDDAMQTELPPVDVAVIDVKQLQKIDPHRYPFLLVDRMVDLRHRAFGDRHQECHGQ